MKNLLLIMAMSLSLISTGAAIASNQLAPLSLSAYQKIGEAELSFMFWDVYKAQYFIDADSDHQALVLNYQMDIKAKDLISETLSQWQAQALVHDNQQHWLDKLALLWPDIEDGDQLAVVVSESASTFYFNEAKLGTLNDADFGPAFLAIWLSENSTEPELRAQLLSGSEK